MKKLLGCFLCVMLLFWLASPAAADILLPDYELSVGGISDVSSLLYGENDTYGDNLVNSGLGTEEARVSAIAQQPVELLYEDTDGSDGWTIGQPRAIVVLKYADDSSSNAPGGFEHWAILDDGDGILQLGTFAYNGGTIELGTHALSHVRSTVPEPATMLLLGSGLIGLAAIGRKKFKK